MKMWFTLGLRSLLKNRRRSCFTIGAVAFGFAAVNVIGGFMNYVFRGLEESYVYAFGNAHLTIFKQGFQTEGKLEPSNYLIDETSLHAILAECQQIDEVLLATPQVQVTGLLSNGDVSTIMVAQGIVPDDAKFIREQASGFMRNLEMFTGEELRNAEEAYISVAYGLAEKLHLNQDSDVITVATTVEGYMNAMDATVVQLQDAPLEILDEMLVTVPFSFAQELYGTQGADRILILLKKGQGLEAMRSRLERQLQASGYEVEVVSWKDLRVSYRRIKSMFNVLFAFVFSVVALIVALSIINTISMAVMERTREIGTLRALGLKQQGVILLFSIESMLLGTIGTLIGLGIHTGTLLLVQAIHPTWIPPNIPKRVPWEIAWAPNFLIVTAICMVLLSIFAAVIPSRKASQMEIIDALGHV